MNRINVSAGQTVLSEKSRIGLAQQMDSPIYYPDYYEIELSATHSLKRLMGTSAEVLIISGNATHAIETALISLIEPGESILSVNSGIFGQVFSEIASITGAKVCELKVPYGNAVQPSDLDLALTKNAEVKAVSIVHIETSTGVLAPLKELAEVVHKHNKLLIVDAVSSLGVTPLEMDKWGIDVLIGSGQKAINAPQGLAIIALSQHAIDTYESRNSQIKSVCLDLGVWREYRRFGVEKMLAAFNNESALPGLPKKVIHGPSPSGPLMKGLNGALQDLENEGFESVYQRHQIAAKAVRTGIRALNLEVLAKEAYAAPSVTTILLPHQIMEFDLRKHMYFNYGIALGAGPVEIGINSFRIGTMGSTAHPSVQLPVLRDLGKGLIDLGHPCNPNAAFSEAEKIFNDYPEKRIIKDS